LISKWRLSENDIHAFDDITKEELKEFQDLLLSEHWDYGMPMVRKEIWNLKTWIFGFDFIKNLFPQIKDEKPGEDFYLYTVFIMFIILAFTLLFFSKISGEKEELKQVLKFNSFGVEIIVIMFA